MKTLLCRIPLAAVLCTSLLFSCSSDPEMPPPPPPLVDESSSSSLVESSSSAISSSARVWSYCVYPEIQECYPGSYSACPGSGGELRDDCPYGSSNHEQSSSGGELAGNSSSSQDGQGNSSGSAAQEYDYCVFAAEKNCLLGPLTICPPGGELSNACPYNSSSSVPNSSSSFASSSSSDLASSGSSGGLSSSSITSNNSSSSQVIAQIQDNVFTDTRDGNNYKFELSGGKVWMSENLNYSKNNTLGYCYGVDIDGENPHRDSTSCGNGYGRIYEWSVAMDGNSSQGLCPSGWHVPSTAEWGNVVSTGTKKMSSNFYIYPGYYKSADWIDRDVNGYYWTSNGNSTLTLFKNGSTCKGGGSCVVEALTGASATDKFSVRCLANDDFKQGCGTGLYAPATEFCSDGKAYTFCSNKTYNTAAQFCSGGTIYNFCGGKTYNPSTEFCLDSKVYEKCGGKTYNPATESCSGGKVYATCGSKSYDTSVEFCSGSTTYPLCGGQSYNPATEFCQDSKVDKICNEFYNSTTQFCSGGKVYDKCGGQIYDVQQRKCVGGKVYLKDADYLITCNGSAISSSECNKTRLDVKNNECIDLQITWTGYNTNRNLIMQCIASYGVSVSSITVDGRNTTPAAGSGVTLISNLSGTREILVCVSLSNSSGSADCQIWND